MMCAIEAGKRGRKVLLIDHAKKAGEKIRISGGGRCNFTNSDCKAGNFISGNPHFIKSALSQYSAADFISLVDRYKISWHEKILGQLFCDNRSTDIVNLLQNEMDLATVEVRLQVEVETVTKDDDGYIIETNEGNFSAKSLVIATGGKSIPKMGATGFGYGIARQFELEVTQTRPALVPLTFDPERLKALVLMAGLGFDCEVSVGKKRFREAALFTHRGLSGPAILQISSYWREGDEIQVDFTTGLKDKPDLNQARQKHGKQEIQNWLAGFYPAPLAKFICNEAGVSGRIGEMKAADTEKLEQVLRSWTVKPAGSEGYRTAEVTLGGVDTNELNSRTMEARKVSGLYFIGEVVDVTGWLGGYNFQWAWSSGYVAGRNV